VSPHRAGDASLGVAAGGALRSAHPRLHPTKYAQRLARRLHATPHRVVEVLDYTEESWARVGREAMAALDPAIRDACKTWNSS
jgi:hypothetical protein